MEELSRREAIEPIPFESQAERRRGHLVATAIRIVATEGVDAVQPAHVAELAGCGRTSVYRYFPRREDLLFAVAEEFYRWLDTRFDGAGDPDGIVALSRFGPSDIARAAERLTSPVWRGTDWSADGELVVAGLAVLRSEAFRAIARDHEAEFAEHAERRWGAALRALGLGNVEVVIAEELALALIHVVTAFVVAGKLGGDDGLRISTRTITALTKALMDDETERGST
jgi:AcrR family transcriptional regulator